MGRQMTAQNSILIHWIWHWRNGSMHPYNTWENFPDMLYMVCYAKYHNSCLRKCDSWRCKCLYDRCALFLYVMGTTLHRFLILVGRLVNNSFLC